jgi:threonine/homoserine/homoserine lactone efflux protein
VIEHVVEVLPPFLLACLAIAALPGPATALFLHRTIRDGRAAGMAAVAGNEVGVFCWALAGGAGLSALLAANRVLFDGLHVLGGVVLVGIGVRAYRTARADTRSDSGEAVADAPTRGRDPSGAFRASLISVAGNPKAAVFAISFFPQFLPRTGAVVPTVLVLATIQVVIDTIWCVSLVMIAARARAWFTRGGVRQRIERTIGVILIALGLELAADTR